MQRREVGNTVKLVAREVRELERDAWDELSRADGELFHQPTWVDALGLRAARVGIFGPGENLVGGFVVSRGRRAGVRVLSNAPFCQSAGPFWRARAQSNIRRLEERRSVVEAMAAFLEPGFGLALVRLSRAAEDVLPFRWRGFRTNVEYTYRLPLSVQGEAYLGGYDGQTRNDVRKAVRDGLTAEVGLNLGEIESLQRSALERNGAGGCAVVAAILGYAREAPGSFTVTVRGTGPCLAASLVLIFRGTAYYVMGGHRREQGKGSHHGAGPLALHTSIVEAARRGCSVFDFEGSTIPRVEPFIRGFGGTLTPYYSVAKAWLPLECVLKLRHRSYF